MNQSLGLRDYLIKLQQEETLKEYLGSDYEAASKEEKEKFLSLVQAQIELDVDRMINEYMDYLEKTAPEKKKNNKIMYVYTLLTLLSTGFLGYAFNNENWVVVAFIYVLLFAVQSLPYIVDRE